MSSHPAPDERRAALIEHAQRLIARDGPTALTMRGLAAEAGCAVGLPYKVFTNRDELVIELISAEFAHLRAEFDKLVGSAGTATVGQNLGRYAELLLRSPAIGLAHEVAHSEALAATVDARAGETGVIRAVAGTVGDYLAAEQRLGRVAPDVDVEAFGFLVSGAVHNLLMSGELYPRPGLRRLKRMLQAVAARLAPTEEQEEHDDADPRTA